MPSKATVLAVSARCPVGLTARQVAMGYRADAFEPREHAVADRHGRAAGVCRVGGLPVDLQGYGRLFALATLALAELLEDARRRGISAATWITAPPPLVLALPEPGRADDDPRLDGAILAEIAAATGVPLDLAGSSVVRTGHAGFAGALAQALAMLDAGAPAVVVGGADSWIDPRVIAALDRAHRLHSLTEDDGFIPSEGAAFALLSRADRGGVARLVHAATAEEEAARTGGPNLSATLRRLVREAAPASGREVFPWVLTDLNGERARTNEWIPVEAQAPVHPNVVLDRGPMRLGDLGAASGAVLFVIASSLLALGCAPDPTALVVLASDGPARGVICVEALGFEGGPCR